MRTSAPSCILSAKRPTQILMPFLSPPYPPPARRQGLSFLESAVEPGRRQAQARNGVVGGQKKAAKKEILFRVLRMARRALGVRAAIEKMLEPY
jgi:hypothetical protein